MKKPIYLSAAFAMAVAAPAVARDQVATTDLRKPDPDSIVHPQGAFYAKWGDTPEEVAKKWEPTWNRLTPIPNRNLPLFDQVPVLSYIYTYGDFSYNFDAFFGPETNGLSLVSLSSDSEAACHALESRLITQLGEGKASTDTTKDEEGEYINQTRVWADEQQQGNFYAYVFLPRNAAGSDYCLTTILDANGGMY